MLLEQQRRDEKAGEDEEEVDAVEAAAQPEEMHAENAEDGDPAQAVQRRDVAQPHP